VASYTIQTVKQWLESAQTIGLTKRTGTVPLSIGLLIRNRPNYFGLTTCGPYRTHKDKRK